MPEPRTTETVRSAAVPDAAARADEPEQGPAPAWRHAVGTVLRTVESRTFKLLFVLAMVGLGIYSVTSQWTDFSRGIDRLGVVAAIEALAFVVLSLLLTLEVWRSLLSAAGSRLPIRASARIFFIGQLGKYIPGSVWPVLAQMELGRTYKVPRQRSATTAMLAMMIGLTSGLLATLIGLPFMAGGSAHTYWWAFLFIPPLLVCLHPKVLNPVIAYGLRLLRKPAPETPLTGRVIGTAIAVNVASWFCYGLQIWVMTARLGHGGGSALLSAVGAYALAWCVGFLIVLAPAGAGIRELILIAELSPMVGSGAATAIALVSRGLTMLADLAGAGVAALLGRGTADPSPAPSEDAA
ncbi:lysylphosphatidylglycerol synthase transmembrane domain-containing protein [Actinospica sp.]|uniref:lysylphosphatidylglycerol synthase transmembrane domain-containing protein n=1 Tax=Actinospica sp. TaxID=1872142 RepID=UPI002C13C5DA|nr:lysylphosphatidylglycerol synthase domain-containing protein [Actinospica sp.]HWG28206.1 lysylphosphatidylglycerol synthase domain-containing protein [Actinospica sp.]